METLNSYWRFWTILTFWGYYLGWSTDDGGFTGVGATSPCCQDEPLPLPGTNWTVCGGSAFVRGGVPPVATWLLYAWWPWWWRFIRITAPPPPTTTTTTAPPTNKIGKSFTSCPFLILSLAAANNSSALGCWEYNSFTLLKFFIDFDYRPV